MSSGDCSQNTNDLGKTQNDKITHELILCMSGEFEIESIQSLKLSERAIEDLTPLEECTGLTRLNLSKNNISSLKSLKGLTMLTHLNLSANSISNIDSLSNLENLIDLNLAGNLICNIDRLKSLKALEHFERLRLRDVVNDLTNPVCNNANYTASLVAMFPNIVVFDGDRVKGRGRELFEICRDLDDQIKKHEDSTHSMDCPCDKCDGNSDNRTVGPVEEKPIPGRWLPEDFFSVPKRSTNLNDSIETASKILAEVKELDFKALHIIQSMKDKV